MRILDLFKREAKQSRQLVLDMAATQHWPQQLIAHEGLDKEFKEFVDRVEELKSACRKQLSQFTNEEILDAIPDRARTINAIHGKEFATQASKLLAAAEFTGILSFDKEQETYFEAAASFKDQSAKNANVLKEFMHAELKSAQATLQQLEDTIIHFTKVLEEHNFPVIRRIHESNQRLAASSQRQERYDQLLKSLEQDLKRTQEKRQKLEEGVNEQQGLIRNEQAAAALEKVRKLEEDLHRITAQYAALAQDLITLYKKKPEIKPPASAKRVLDELAKDSQHFLATGSSIKEAFEEITQQLEEEQLRSRPLIERLSRLAASAENDSRKVQTTIPDLRSLKRDVMKDVAALQIYDKTQFLLRAQAEEEVIQHKISYLKAEMDPSKREVLEREIKDAAKSLGAIVKDRPAQEAQQA